MFTHRRTCLPLLLGGLLLGACDTDLTVPDYTNPPLGDLLNNPTPELIRQAATGIMQQSRDAVNGSQGYVVMTAITGREGYYLDRNEPRYVTNIAQGNPNRANFTGNSYWVGPYRNIRNANLLVAALDKVDMPQADEEALRGFAKTFKGLEYLQILAMRDSIPIFTNTAITELREPPPFAQRKQAMEYVAAVLDSAYTHLQAGGSSFSFPMPSGFTQFGFNTPARFAQFNRALKARVEAYLASPLIRPAYSGRAAVAGTPARYANVLTALSQSFITTAGSVSDPVSDRTLLNIGAYQTYSAGSGDTPNNLFDPSGKTVAERSLRTDAERRLNGQRDARYVVKIDSVATATSVSGVTSELRFAIYGSRPFYGGGSQASPIPIIRNEELILLRSEARWFTGDRPGAMADLNFIRVNSGGLALIAQPASDADYLTALLKERRYSLMFEGGHRWIDARRFGRLSTLQANSISVTRANATSPSFFPVPQNECLPRGTTTCL
ncbi:MAG TPA: RagB/SusD family nutrient uptake outer membrane protein [Longimicrobiaceae bacterium]|nr:RagB/SusD family nutrient uptake outer membrane protein [Longimicrobiaceae bacterium]